jgi:Na+/H+ antiporter NhaD/arsenite permease-like protein
VTPAATSPEHLHPTAILAVFAVTYAGIAVGRIPGLKLNRVGIALLGAIGMMVFGGVDTSRVASFINWPTIFLLFAFFVISAQLRLSGFYDRVAGAVAARLVHPGRFLLVLMAATAGLSAILNNDIVCYAFVPVVGTALIRQRINPVPFLVALGIASNIGAAATVVGNAQNMMIAQIAGLGFGPYLAWSAVPVLFALGAAWAIVWMMSRRHLRLEVPPAEGRSQDPQPYNRGHTIKGLVLLAAVIGLFFSPIPKEVTALAAAAIHLASRKFRTEDLLRLVDWPILVLFAGLFVVTGAFVGTGAGFQVVADLSRLGIDLDRAPVLAVATAALSNLIGNSAAVMLLVKVVDLTRPALPYVLAVANSFGGNLIIVGSVANIIVVQQARELGVEISFRSFARLGIPVTAAALAGLIGWVAIVG